MGSDSWFLNSSTLFFFRIFAVTRFIFSYAGADGRAIVVLSYIRNPCLFAFFMRPTLDFFFFFLLTLSGGFTLLCLAGVSEDGETFFFFFF